MSAASCPGRRVIDGQTITCTSATARHRGPHAGPGVPPIAGAAWCDLPCRGQDCAGPCHAGDPAGAR